jgi:cysteine-rich repeat protein
MQTLRNEIAAGPATRKGIAPALAALGVAAWGACDADVDSIARSVAGPAPDYVVTQLGDPPPAAVNGGAFVITTTVSNVGTVDAAISSTTRYVLSVDQVAGSDIAFRQTATVPVLAAGAADTQTVILAIPGGVPSGEYFILACADRRNDIRELDERNNCAASAARVAVTGPDLVVDVLGDPPASLGPGMSFSITDTTRNGGTAAAASSVVGYFLSSTPVRGPGAHRLTKQRSIGPLAAGEASTGTVTALVPAAVPPGTYFLIACADRRSQVFESNEKNNCVAASGTTALGPADLVVSSVGDPPSSIAAGGTFSIADTTANVGNRLSRWSTTRFFLSDDDLPGADLSVAGSRTVSELFGGRSSSGVTELRLDRTTPPGEYVLVACADVADVVEELSETNNCTASATQVTVTEPVMSCGDGILTSPEECDDGNFTDDDGCDNDCVATGIIHVEAGGAHSCALLRSGGVRCWGTGTLGRLGYGNTNTIGDNETPSAAGSVDVGGKVVELSAGVGGGHTCALLESGEIRCWGVGLDGQLGTGSTTFIGDDEPAAAGGVVDLGGTAVEVSVGGTHACARLTTGAVRCWGQGSLGQLGYGNTDNIGDNETPASAGDVNVGGPVIQLAAGHGHTCALLSTGAVRCWGSAEHGHLGYGNINRIGDNETPASAGNVNLGAAAVEIAAGSSHTCARLVGGAVRCWGGAFVGALGYGNQDNIGDDEAPASAGPVNLGTATAVEIDVGFSHTCARLDSGAVKCWGSGRFGQLGYGNVNNIGDNETPASVGVVDLGGQTAQIATGNDHNCALLNTGALRCWGWGIFGELGYGNTSTIGDNESPASVGPVRVF